MPATLPEIKKRLWNSTGALRTFSRLKASEYSVAVRGLVVCGAGQSRYAVAA
ncbi:MAG TPA: hypothetical protein VM536_19870 [Chloroflexia bacterium]|nr:hypothetical protein [Chloroflexia bacterium]